MLNKALTLCEEQNAKLLFLSKFGSHLYGTNTPESDVDLKGIFFPSLTDLLMQKKIKSLNYTTSTSNLKNNKDDIDIDLWSLQYWIELVQIGDTGAIDLLYSISYPEQILFKHNLINVFLENPLKLLNPINTTSYISYCINQAKKYGVKGSRLGVIKNIHKFLEEWINSQSLMVIYKNISEVIPLIIDKFYDEQYCFTKELKTTDGKMKIALFICGKQHQEDIKIGEFYNRLQNEFEKYGERSKLAEQNLGIDWKALSHAVRCIDQFKELLLTEKINFPIKNAEKILNIKKGLYSWKTVEEIILTGLEEIAQIQATIEFQDRQDQKFIENSVISVFNSLYQGCS